MSWCFAIINGRLAELYFERKNWKVKFLGHAYVKADEFTTKSEQNAIAEDIKIHQFSYRKGKYRRILL